MKQHLKKLLLLTIGVCSLALCLAACAEEKAGADWRTTGVVKDTGTVRRGGEDVAVCVCLDANGVSLYYDDDTHTLFDSVTFPETVDDAESNYGGISFYDRNGDGESDLSIDFSNGDMGDAHFVWYWEGEAGYVFQPDISYIGGEAG